MTDATSSSTQLPTLSIGNTLPEFSLPATSERTITPKDLKGHYTVLYFYPKDNTPGCTTEGQEFSEYYSAFQAQNCEIFGVSRDSVRKHENFKAKYNFPFELISDEEEQLCHLFDVIKLKKNYGREYFGIERSTFLLDSETHVIYEWRKVKTKGHAQAVLEKLIALQE